MEDNMITNQYIARKTNAGNSQSLRTSLLNECLFGQTKPYILDALTYFNEQFNFVFDDCYICVTGLKKSVYTKIYNVLVNEYMQIFMHIESTITEILSKGQYKGEVFFIRDDNTKQIAVLYSPLNKSTISAEQIAQRIATQVQEIYECFLFNGSKRYCNFTVLSSHIAVYEDIGMEFENLKALNELSFFYMEPIAMTSHLANVLYQEVKYEDIMAELKTLDETISNGNEQGLAVILGSVFKQLKYAFNWELCHNTLSEIKKLLHTYSMLYDDLLLPDDIDVLCQLSAYANIEECHDTLQAVIMKCVLAAKKSGVRLSYITQETIQYLKNHYREDISLHSIAQYVNISPNYISRVFNREIGMSIREYLMHIRIEKAKQLLCDKKLKVYEVAAQVGMNNARYFSQVFKKHTGVSPGEFEG